MPEVWKNFARFLLPKPINRSRLPSVVFGVTVGFGGECARRGELRRVLRLNPPLFTSSRHLISPKIHLYRRLRKQVSTALVFLSDNAEEHEKLELRSRTEVRVTEGETEESVIYQFTGKVARE